MDKTLFDNQDAAYSCQHIMEAFVNLCEKVKVYDPETNRYDLSKSEILHLIFKKKGIFT